MTEQIKNRLFSLLWRAGGMTVIFILDGLLTMMSDGTIDVPQTYVVLAGLVLGEITKAIRNAVYLK